MVGRVGWVRLEENVAAWGATGSEKLELLRGCLLVDGIQDVVVGDEAGEGAVGLYDDFSSHLVVFGGKEGYGLVFLLDSGESFAFVGIVLRGVGVGLLSSAFLFCGGGLVFICRCRWEE